MRADGLLTRGLGIFACLTVIAIGQRIFGALQQVFSRTKFFRCISLRTRLTCGLDGLARITHLLHGNTGTSGKQCRKHEGKYDFSQRMRHHEHSLVIVID